MNLVGIDQVSHVTEGSCVQTGVNLLILFINVNVYFVSNTIRLKYFWKFYRLICFPVSVLAIVPHVLHVFLSWVFFVNDPSLVIRVCPVLIPLPVNMGSSVFWLNKSTCLNPTCPPPSQLCESTSLACSWHAYDIYDQLLQIQLGTFACSQYFKISNHM